MSSPQDRSCCCFHIKTCATLAGIVGFAFLITAIILAVVSVIGLIVIIPLIFGLLTYIFILFGVANENPGVLLAAEIFLGIQTMFSILFGIVFLILGFATENAIHWAYQELQENDFYVQPEKRLHPGIQIWFLVLSLTVLICLTWFIYCWVIVHRTRTWLKTRHSYAIPTTGMHVYNSAPNTPKPQMYLTKPVPRTYIIPRSGMQISNPNHQMVSPVHQHPQTSSPAISSRGIIYPQILPSPETVPHDHHHDEYVNESFVEETK